MTSLIGNTFRLVFWEYIRREDLFEERRGIIIAEVWKKQYEEDILLFFGDRAAVSTGEISMRWYFIFHRESLFHDV